jgi:hypothetical protein
MSQDKSKRKYLSDSLDLLAEWHEEKNSPYCPSDFFAGSNKKFGGDVTKTSNNKG